MNPRGRERERESTKINIRNKNTTKVPREWWQGINGRASIQARTILWRMHSIRTEWRIWKLTRHIRAGKELCTNSQLSSSAGFFSSFHLFVYLALFFESISFHFRTRILSPPLDVCPPQYLFIRPLSTVYTVHYVFSVMRLHLFEFIIMVEWVRPSHETSCSSKEETSSRLKLYKNRAYIQLNASLTIEKSNRIPTKKKK